MNKVRSAMQATHLYIGRKPCGCAVAAVTDLGDKDTAESVADYIKSGMTVERITVEQYRDTPIARCRCKKVEEVAAE